MKTTLKWLAALAGLAIAAAVLDGMDFLTRAVVCSAVGFAFALYSMEKAAAERHAQLINRLDRLWERGQPYRGDE